MKAVYINLDRAPGRRAWMEDQARRYGFAIDRLSAVDARELDDQEAARMNAGPPGLVSKAAIACFLSHRKAWKIAAGHGHTAIFEDDVHLSPSIGGFLSAPAWIPADADIIRLEFVQERPIVGIPKIEIIAGRCLRRLYGGDTASAGYIISHHCAAKLLEEFPPLTEEFDQILFAGKSRLFRELRIYNLFPSLCVQDQRAARFGIRPQGFAGAIDRPDEGKKPRGLALFLQRSRRDLRRYRQRFFSPERAARIETWFE